MSHRVYQRIQKRITAIPQELQKLQGLIKATRDSVVLPDYEKVSRLDIYKEQGTLLSEEHDRLNDWLKDFTEAEVTPGPTLSAFEQFQKAFVTSLRRDADKQHEPYLVSGKKSYTRAELADELEGATEQGNQLLVTMLNLSAHLISRDKSLGAPDSSLAE